MLSDLPNVATEKLDDNSIDDQVWLAQSNECIHCFSLIVTYIYLKFYLYYQILVPESQKFMKQTSNLYYI